MQILNDLRKQANLTLRQVEEATGISNSYLSQLESGKIKHPSAQSLYLLAKLYSSNIEDLLIAAGMIKEEDSVMPIKMKASIEQRVEKLEQMVNELRAKNIVFGNQLK